MSLGLIASACYSLPEAEWEGESIAIASDHDVTMCGGTNAYLDLRTGLLLQKLGPISGRLQYYWLEDVAEYCPRNPMAQGCADVGVVFSQWVPHLHEIVHARAGDGMPLVLEEGLATHFGDPYPIREMASRERLRELLTQTPDDLRDTSEYARAAHFLAFLSETHGWQVMPDLDSLLSPDSTVDDIDAAFSSVLDSSLDELLAQYAEYPDCSGNVDVTIACAGDAVQLDALQPTLERRVDCAASDTLGPYSGLVFTEDIIELSPAIDGSRFVQVVGDGAERGGRALIRRCGPCSEKGVVLGTRELAFVPEADLPAGRYIVQLLLPADGAPADLGVHISG